MNKIDSQLMSEKLSVSKEIKVLGLRGTGYEGDILDVVIDGKLFYFVIDYIIES